MPALRQDGVRYFASGAPELVGTSQESVMSISPVSSAPPQALAAPMTQGASGGSAPSAKPDGDGDHGVESAAPPPGSGRGTAVNTTA